MKKMLTIITTVCLVLGINYGASAWIYLPNQGDTGWQTYTYTAGLAGFAGTAGFVVSNVIDDSNYPELLLDNLKGGGGTNLGFENGLKGFTLVGTSFANVSTSETLANYNTYSPTQGDYFAVIQGLFTGVSTSQFSNATGQAGTVGSILETAITLGAGAHFTFDWAFLGNDFSPWNDFGLFYLRDKVSGAIVFSQGLAQIGYPAPIPGSLLLLGSGLLSLLGLAGKGKRQD